MARMRRRPRIRGVGMPEMILTPLIDTVLVLLVVFMMTTPMLHNYITVELPKGSSNDEAAASDVKNESVTVSLDKNGKIFINDTAVTRATFFDALEKILAGTKERVVFVSADRSIPYGTVIQIVDDIKYLGGVKYVALATEHA